MIALAVSGNCWLASGRAGWFSHHREGTPPPGRPREIEHTLHRAGHPEALSGHAAMTNTPEYLGYYVGGSATHAGGGDPRAWYEGTWGWDYEGLCLRRHVALGWLHGRRARVGDRAYRSDVPHFTDVFIVPRHANDGNP